ncbi:MAG: hypothetical protein KZQ65_08850, partial [Candidatus Thiodiazotropha sp. (ex Gloverina cf. vestifex)]|nr:hypothetical protein [Candidatus Thiodiazotropha sp. (ex Gloverina cf. vestifex)]
YALHRSLTVTITAIQPRLRLSGTNRLGFQPSMAISGGFTCCIIELQLLLEIAKSEKFSSIR